MDGKESCNGDGRGKDGGPVELGFTASCTRSGSWAERQSRDELSKGQANVCTSVSARDEPVFGCAADTLYALTSPCGQAVKLCSLSSHPQTRASHAYHVISGR